MIYCTGDTHGDLSRFDDKRLKKLKKGDYLIICGDFGFIWNGSKKENKILKKLGRKKYGILFVEGAHENHKLLSEYPESDWNGGRVRQISGRLKQLCRGSVFDIDGAKIFAFGGGLSPESESGFDPDMICVDALPTADDIKTAVRNLEAAGRAVDYIVSYEPPSVIEMFVNLKEDEVLQKNHLNALFDEIVKCVSFKMWVFGKCHKNKTVSPKYTAVYTSFVELKTDGDEKRRKKGK